MTEPRQPRFSIPIHKDDQVTSTREGGLINRPTWAPDEGVARAKEIAEARLQAQMEYEERIAATHPHRVLLDTLALRVSALEELVHQMRNDAEE